MRQLEESLGIEALERAMKQVPFETLLVDVDTTLIDSNRSRGGMGRRFARARR